MFDDLQKRLSTAFRRFASVVLLTEANMKEGLREVRTALLEADVHFDVVQEFMARINDEAVGTQLIKSVRPEQQIVKIVHDELIELMGPVDPSIRFEKAGTDRPDVVRPSGVGQDDDLRQARSAACSRKAASRCWSRPTFSGRRPSSSSRSSALRSAFRSSARPIQTRWRSVSRPWPRPTAPGAIR